MKRVGCNAVLQLRIKNKSYHRAIYHGFYHAFLTRMFVEITAARMGKYDRH